MIGLTVFLPIDAGACLPTAAMLSVRLKTASIVIDPCHLQARWRNTIEFPSGLQALGHEKWLDSRNSSPS